MTMPIIGRQKCTGLLAAVITIVSLLAIASHTEADPEAILDANEHSVSVTAKAF